MDLKTTGGRPPEQAAAAHGFTDIDRTAINTIRTLTIDAVEKADSGHAGSPMGQAPFAYTLWTRFLQYAPAEPRWPNRDRFVLSAGHGSMLLYALLHLAEVVRLDANGRPRGFAIPWVRQDELALLAPAIRFGDQDSFWSRWQIHFSIGQAF